MFNYMISESIVKRRVNSMFYDLYERFAEDVGEDVSILILEMCGFVPIDLQKAPPGYFERRRVESKLRDLADNYNLTYEKCHHEMVPLWMAPMSFDREKRPEYEKRIRNYCFRHNIKIYHISEVVYNRQEKRTLLPMGRAFEHRPIVHNGKIFKILNYTEFNGNHYLVVDYFSYDKSGPVYYDIARIN